MNSIWGLFCRTVEHRPDSDAIVQGNTRLSFGELRARALCYAAWFQREGLRPGDRVLLWMDAHPELAAGLLGVWAAGGIPALIDTKTRPSQLDHALAMTTPKFLLALGSEAAPRQVSDARLVIPDRVPADPTGFKPPNRVLTTSPASIVFTSGSTGRPKGVTQSNGSLVRGCLAVSGYLGVSSEDRILCPIPWSFDYGFVQLQTTFVTGAAQILPVAQNPFAVCEAIEKHRPTVFPGIPSLFTYLMQGVSPLRKTDVSSIRTVTNTGGSIPGPVLRDLIEFFKGRRIFLNYGLTETYRTTFLDPTLIGERPTSIGKPIPGVDVAIVREDGTQADAGEVGQIVHRGDCICLGYWNDPEATAAALRPDPLLPECCPTTRPALYTGDYGRIDEEGYLYFHGRRDHLLKSMGVRVSPKEIEELLYESGLVREAAVFGQKHDLLGDEVWAAIVAAENTEDPSKQLAKYARDTMSPYMMPRRFLVKESLPKTSSGKIDYEALKSEAAQDSSASMTGK